MAAELRFLVFKGRSHLTGAKMRKSAANYWQRKIQTATAKKSITT